jgi:hypothetical protein
MAKDQRRAVARRQPDELLIGCLPYLRGLQNDCGQLLQPIFLVFDQQLRVANDIDEENMPDLKSQMIVRFGFHRVDLVGNLACSDNEFLWRLLRASHLGEIVKRLTRGPQENLNGSRAEIREFETLIALPASRFPIPDSRFTIHDSRFTIHDSRFTIHDSRVS